MNDDTFNSQELKGNVTVQENHEPAKEHNFCFVCNREFKDFQVHIVSDKHKMNF